VSTSAIETSSRPASVTNPDGSITNVTNYDAVKGFPGQSAPCEYCGAEAADAPEGVFGVHAKVIKGANVGDPVWQAAHCFKCGFRGGAVVEDMTMQFNKFKAWLQGESKKDLAHPTVSADNGTDAEKEALKVALAEAEAKLAALPQEVAS
jgi:hypothetical protein